MLGGLPDKARVSRGGRVHAKRVKAKLPQAVDQAAISAPDVENPRTRGERRGDGRVKVLPPPGAGHGPRPYPVLPGCASGRGGEAISPAPRLVHEGLRRFSPDG